MAEDVATVDSTAVEIDATAEIPDARKATDVWKHPDRELIHHLLRVGKSAFWIQCWLEDRYPETDVDDDGDTIPHTNAVQHKKWQLGSETIERYRASWMPECAAGIDVVDEDLEEMIGRKFPGATRWEIEVMEASLQVAQKNLVRALTADEKMGMLQQITLDATGALQSAAERLLNAKSKLGMPGYEAAAEHTVQEIHSTNVNKNLSVELHGRVGRDGKALPGDPEAVQLMREMMALPPAERTALVEAHKAIAPPPPEAEVVSDVPAAD